MTNYPFFKKLIHSFYSKELYAFVGRQNTSGIGIKYLFFLLCIFWIPEMVKLHVSISDSIKNELPVFLEKFPVITIKNGVTSIDKPSPYIIKDDETGNDLMIFDMSGENTSLENTEAQLLLTASTFIYRKSAMETREYDLSNINDFSLTHEKIRSWAEIGNYISILLYLLIIPCALLYRMFLVLIYSLVGLIIQAILQTKYSFGKIYHLAVIAITPAFVADKLLGYFDIDFFGWSLLCFMISIGYLFFALKSNKDADQLSSSEFGTNDGSSNSSI